jgi:hypothetical protein
MAAISLESRGETSPCTPFVRATRTRMRKKLIKSKYNSFWGRSSIGQSRGLIKQVGEQQWPLSNAVRLDFSHAKSTLLRVSENRRIWSFVPGAGVNDACFFGILGVTATALESRAAFCQSRGARVPCWAEEGARKSPANFRRTGRSEMARPRLPQGWRW